MHMYTINTEECLENIFSALSLQQLPLSSIHLFHASISKLQVGFVLLQLFLGVMGYQIYFRSRLWLHLNHLKTDLRSIRKPPTSQLRILRLHDSEFPDSVALLMTQRSYQLTDNRPDNKLWHLFMVLILKVFREKYSILKLISNNTPMDCCSKQNCDKAKCAKNIIKQMNIIK